MNIDEKNPSQNESVEEAVEIQETARRGLPLGALIGIIAGAVAVVVAVVLIILLGGKGNKCDAHVDADDDYLCDKCGESYDDGDEVVVPESNKVEVTFTVKLDNGNVLSDVKFILTRKGQTFEFTSGSDGIVKASLEVGNYYLNFDQETLPEYCMCDLPGIVIAEDTTSIVLKITDNRPDGSEIKPFHIEGDDTQLTLASGQEIFYQCRVGITTYITVNSSKVTISYNGTVYEAIDGVVQATLEPSDENDKPVNTNDMEVFSVKNTSDEEITVTMVRSFVLGSNENPEILTEGYGSAQVKTGQTHYFVWTADQNGVMILSSPTENGSIKVTRTLKKEVYSEISGENEIILVPILADMVADNVYVLYVKAGDEIKIEASYVKPMNDTVTEDSSGTEIDDGSTHTVEFSFDIYAGNEQEPIPVEISTVSLTIDKGVTLSFVAEQGKTVTVSSEHSLTVIYGGAQISAGDDGKVHIELIDSTVFEVAIPQDQDTYKIIISLN